MPSLKSRLIIAMFKYRNIFTLKLKRRPLIDWNTSIPELRERVNKPNRLFGKLPANISTSDCTIGNIYAKWVKPTQTNSANVILYFHGGGYVLGSVNGHLGHTARFVAATGTPALLFAYRLAPEHPFPAALDDSLAAYNHLLASGYNPQQIIFMGDSAGGGLALATMVALKQQQLPLPAKAVVLSPWTDLACAGETLTSLEKHDPLTWRQSWTIFSHYYRGQQDPTNPLVSPLYADLAGFPPLLIYAGGHELLLADSTRFAQKAKQAGVDVTLKIGEGMFHCYPVCGNLFPESRQAFQHICQFIGSPS